MCLAKHALPPAVAFATHDHGPPDTSPSAIRPLTSTCHPQGPTARLSAFVGLASSPPRGPSGDWIVSTRADLPPPPPSSAPLSPEARALPHINLDNPHLNHFSHLHLALCPPIGHNPPPRHRSYPWHTRGTPRLAIASDPPPPLRSLLRRPPLLFIRHLSTSPPPSPPLFNATTC